MTWLPRDIIALVGRAVRDWRTTMHDHYESRRCVNCRHAGPATGIAGWWERFWSQAMDGYVRQRTRCLSSRSPCHGLPVGASSSCSAWEARHG